MFSQDEDLLIEAHRRQVEGIDFAGVIYARQSSKVKVTSQLVIVSVT